MKDFLFTEPVNPVQLAVSEDKLVRLLLLRSLGLRRVLVVAGCHCLLLELHVAFLHRYVAEANCSLMDTTGRVL